MSADTKAPSAAALRRKIERLEAQVEALQAKSDKAFASYSEVLLENVDAKMRIEQSIKLLLGEDV